MKLYVGVKGFANPNEIFSLFYEGYVTILYDLKHTFVFKLQGSKANSDNNVVMNVFVQFVLARGLTDETQNAASVSSVLGSIKSPLNKDFIIKKRKEKENPSMPILLFQ